MTARIRILPSAQLTDDEAHYHGTSGMIEVIPRGPRSTSGGGPAM